MVRRNGRNVRSSRDIIDSGRARANPLWTKKATAEHRDLNKKRRAAWKRGKRHQATGSMRGTQANKDPRGRHLRSTATNFSHLVDPKKLEDRRQRRKRRANSGRKAHGSRESSRDAFRKSQRERRIKKYKAREDRMKARKPAVHRTRDKSLPMWKRYGAKSEASWKGMGRKARIKERKKQDWDWRKAFLRKNPGKFRGGVMMGSTHRNGKLVGAFAGNKKDKKGRLEQFIKNKDRKFSR